MLLVFFEMDRESEHGIIYRRWEMDFEQDDNRRADM